MVLGIKSKSRKTSVSIQVHYTIHVLEIKPWPPSQSLRSVKSVLLQWENGEENAGSLASIADNGKIEFNEPFRLPVLMWREESKKGKNRESFKKNCLEFHLYDTTVKNQLLGSATINFAEFGIIKVAKPISIQLNCKKSYRNSAQPFLYVNIQPFDIECSSSSPNSNLSKEFSLDKEESESASQSFKDDGDDNIEIASFTDDESNDTPSSTLQTIKSSSDTTGGSIEISEGGSKGSSGELTLQSENTNSSLLGKTKIEASAQVNDIKSPTSSTVLYSGLESAANGRHLLPKISEERVKVADASSSETQESIQQSRVQNIAKGDMFKAKSPASYISSNVKPQSEISSRSQVNFEDSMSQEYSKENQRYNKDFPEKVRGVSNIGVMGDRMKMDERRKGRQQFTTSNEILENVLDDNASDAESTREGTLKSDTLLLSEKSDDHPKGILMNDKAEDVRNVNFASQPTESCGKFSSSQTVEKEEIVSTSNGVYVGAACQEDINVNDSFLNDNTELKAEVERLREELMEAAALEASMYSVIAEHSSSNKVHAPARRLSRFYFHARRTGSLAKIASASQSAVSGFVLVSKACGNDVPRLTFWFSNIILLRAIVSKGVENINLGDSPCINSECGVNGSPLHEDKKENTEEHMHSWKDPETFLVALEKVEAWIFSRIVESVWWQTLTPYMQSAAAKSSRKISGKRFVIGDQDQGNFSIDLWKRAFKDACERLCPLRTGGLECGCLPVISRMVMEQLVNRLDVAMFNAILRESAEEMPTDPISDPISDSKVLPISAGKSGFGAGAQLKNAIGDWSRWLSDLFSIDDSHENNCENGDPKYESSFKPFHLLNALSDLMMLPSDMLADGSMRKEVCPRFGISLIRQVVNNFVPDEFSPKPIPDSVLESLNNEDIEDEEGSITSFPCSAGSTFYAPPHASSVVGMLQEVGTQSLIRSGSLMVKKLYTSDDELDELDSPISAIGMDDPMKKFGVVNGGRKVVRYELLRQVWKSSDE